jgi:hypothetical protein
MKKGKNSIPAIFLVLAGFSLLLFLGSKGYAQTERKPLSVNFSYAPEKIRKGEVWKIYLSVSDPEGNMKKVTFSISEPGATRYRPSFMYLKKGMERDFSGYFALHTAASRDLSGVEITLNLSILDAKGNVRGDFNYPLEFDGRQVKPLPPEMEAKLNQRIGIIDIELDIPD